MKKPDSSGPVASPMGVSTAGEERVLSGLEVEGVLNVGRERLFLLFTQSRLILAHHARKGRSAVPLYGLLGKMSEGLGRGPAKQGAIQKLADSTPEQILAFHPENFSIEYPRVVSLMIQPDSANNRMRILLVTANQRFELYASLTAAEGIREFVHSVLADRLEYRR